MLWRSKLALMHQMGSNKLIQNQKSDFWDDHFQNCPFTRNYPIVFKIHVGLSHPPTTIFIIIRNPVLSQVGGDSVKGLSCQNVFVLGKLSQIDWNQQLLQGITFVKWPCVHKTLELTWVGDHRFHGHLCNCGSDITAIRIVAHLPYATNIRPTIKISSRPQVSGSHVCNCSSVATAKFISPFPGWCVTQVICRSMSHKSSMELVKCV